MGTKDIKEKTLKEMNDIDKQPCDKCNGQGVIDNIMETGRTFLQKICPKCHGHKELDFVEMIVGKTIPHFDEKDFFVDTSKGVTTVTLPKTPNEGDTIHIRYNTEDEIIIKT